MRKYTLMRNVKVFSLLFVLLTSCQPVKDVWHFYADTKDTYIHNQIEEKASKETNKLKKKLKKKIQCKVLYKKVDIKGSLLITNDCVKGTDKIHAYLYINADNLKRSSLYVSTLLYAVLGKLPKYKVLYTENKAVSGRNLHILVVELTDVKASDITGT